MGKTLVRNFIICERISRLDFGIFKIRKSKRNPKTQKNPKIRNPPFPPWEKVGFLMERLLSVIQFLAQGRLFTDCF